MSEHENIFWHVDALDIEAERVEFESTLDATFPRDRDFVDGFWEYKDNATWLIFRGWVQARLSARRTNRAMIPMLAEGGLMTQSIDTDEFHELICGMQAGDEGRWDLIIRHIEDYASREVDAVLGLVSEAISTIGDRGD